MLSFEEFDKTLGLIETGEATEDELKDCLLFCAGTVLETGLVFKALVKGYSAHLATIAREDQKLRAAREFARKAVDHDQR